jgi:hypothetical protein
MRRFAKPLYGLTPVPRVRIPPSPPRSLNCGEVPLLLTSKYATGARISRLFPNKPDWKERTAGQRRRALCRLFSGGHMRSPVSRGALGECNAITSRGFDPSELTFVSTLETEFGLSISPFGRTPSCRQTGSYLAVQGCRSRLSLTRECPVLKIERPEGHASRP